MERLLYETQPFRGTHIGFLLRRAANAVARRSRSRRHAGIPSAYRFDRSHQDLAPSAEYYLPRPGARWEDVYARWLADSSMNSCRQRSSGAGARYSTACATRNDAGPNEDRIDFLDKTW